MFAVVRRAFHAGVKEAGSYPAFAEKSRPPGFGADSAMRGGRKRRVSRQAEGFGKKTC